jgi:NTP pyrophosphatase (non-canonical NTP hydrolase)
MGKKKQGNANGSSAKGPVARSRARVVSVGKEHPFETIFDVQLGLELQARIGHTFRSISEANLRRADRWHAKGLDDWTTLEWAGAMTGEAGEAANVAKKLRRFDMGIHGATQYKKKREELVAKLASEIAGTFMYLDLLAQKEGIDIRRAVVEEFNRVSEREGFPERL